MKTRRMSNSVHDRNARRVMLARGEYLRAPKLASMYKPGESIDVHVDLPQVMLLCGSAGELAVLVPDQVVVNPVRFQTSRRTPHLHSISPTQMGTSS